MLIFPWSAIGFQMCWWFAQESRQENLFTIYRVPDTTVLYCAVLSLEDNVVVLLLELVKHCILATSGRGWGRGVCIDSLRIFLLFGFSRKQNGKLVCFIPFNSHSNSYRFRVLVRLSKLIFCEENSSGVWAWELHCTIVSIAQCTRIHSFRQAGWQAFICSLIWRTSSTFFPLPAKFLKSGLVGLWAGSNCKRKCLYKTKTNGQILYTCSSSII